MAIVREDHRSLDQILQFPHISRPGIGFKGRESFRRNLTDALSHAPGKDLHVVQDELRNVFASLSKRRQLDRKNVKTIIKITAELIVIDHFKEISVRGRDQPDVHFVSPAATQALEFLFLQNSQQFRLQRQRNIADLVQKERSLIRQFKAPHLLGDSSGESSPLMAKEFAL